MAKKPDNTAKHEQAQPVTKKTKPKKGAVDIHQLDLFFTAYTPPVKENEVTEVREGEPVAKGIEKMLTNQKIPVATKETKPAKASTLKSTAKEKAPAAKTKTSQKEKAKPTKATAVTPAPKATEKKPAAKPKPAKAAAKPATKKPAAKAKATTAKKAKK